MYKYNKTHIFFFMVFRRRQVLLGRSMGSQAWKSPQNRGLRPFVFSALQNVCWIKLDIISYNYSLDDIDDVNHVVDSYFVISNNRKTVLDDAWEKIRTFFETSMDLLDSLALPPQDLSLQMALTIFWNMTDPQQFANKSKATDHDAKKVLRNVFSDVELKNISLLPEIKLVMKLLRDQLFESHKRLVLKMKERKMKELSQWVRQ